jgi:lipopolysaccharide/colanic/teichoic acid biosynthesis glycosyltransferase
VFVLQQRVGLGGRRFTMWKFRSMTVDAEARELELAHLNIYGNGTFKLRDDPRVTRVGKFLRRTSLDELPQLFNVLMGDMSIVGPRPALVNDINRYEPHHFERLSVVPGITGPWQVNGRNLITDFETIVKMERDYISSWSLVLDAKIMLRTIGVVVRGDGAY